MSYENTKEHCILLALLRDYFGTIFIISVVDIRERLPSHTENPAFGALQMVIIDSGHECIFSENVCSKKKKQNDCHPTWVESLRTKIKAKLVKQHCFV